MSQAVRIAAPIIHPRELAAIARAIRADRLERFSARFAYIVIAANALIFVGQFIRWALS